MIIDEKDGKPIIILDSNLTLYPTPTKEFLESNYIPDDYFESIEHYIPGITSLHEEEKKISVNTGNGFVWYNTRTYINLRLSKYELDALKGYQSIINQILKRKNNERTIF